MKILVTVLIILSWDVAFGDSLTDKIKTQTDFLKAQNIDTIIVHRYSLFNGRFTIPYEDKVLECDNKPTVAHIFWVKQNQWYCLRLDNCGFFEEIKIKTIKVNKLDTTIEFKKKSAHFAHYKLTITSSKNEETVSVSGDQLLNEKSETIQTFNAINGTIQGLESTHRFKRVK